MVATVDAMKPRADREAALNSLYQEVHQKNLFPFWATGTDVKHDEINQLLGSKRAVAFLWSYRRDLEPLLYRSAELVTMNDSERRSLILVNPGLTPRRATVATMYTAYRLNDPNEVMPPHKHTASAVRFGLAGAQNFTGVEGEDIVFGPGDLVLTPRDTWHNHGNLGTEPAINLSVLDLPLVEQLSALSFEHDYMEGAERIKKQTPRYSSDYSTSVYGAGGLRPRFVDHHRGVAGASPMYVYRYAVVRELLERHRDHDTNPNDGLAVEYVNPLTGGPVIKTMTFFMQMLRPGEHTFMLRQTASMLITPFEGRGHSIVDGQRFDWEPFDTLAIPGGCWFEHLNASESEPAILFVASDEPALRAFGLLQRWGRRPDGDLIRIE
jgi:gentisate 1,2-dioxygenase